MSNSNRLNAINQQPRWMADNIYLLHGHRPQTDSYLECLRSVFKLHNETVNIWTHLIPCFMFFCLLYGLVTSDTYNITDKIFIGSFHLGAIACHAFSGIYHIFMSHSEVVGKYFQKLDFIGIILLITFSIVSWVHCVFGYLDPIYARTYSIGYITFASVLMWFITNEKYCDDSYIGFRTTILTIFALTANVPGIHWLTNNWHLKFDFLKLSVVLEISQAIYFTGALLYAYRIPERFHPGRFDIFFNSHQIFHVCCTIAALLHHYGLIKIIAHFKTFEDSNHSIIK